MRNREIIFDSLQTLWQGGSHIEMGIEHTKALFCLADIGNRFKLDVWIGEKHHKSIYNGDNLGKSS